jgi:hypothetical protein
LRDRFAVNVQSFAPNAALPPMPRLPPPAPTVDNGQGSQAENLATHGRQQDAMGVRRHCVGNGGSRHSNEYRTLALGLPPLPRDYIAIPADDRAPNVSAAKAEAQKNSRRESGTTSGGCGYGVSNRTEVKRRAGHQQLSTNHPDAARSVRGTAPHKFAALKA